MHKRKPRPLLSALFALSFLLTGCTPEERTMLLPMISSGEEAEETDSAEDFTVKKIYTYTYETMSELEKSAFLQDCKENELLIIARSEQEEDSLIYRQLDYRYGFYDSLGEISPLWEDRGSPSGGEKKGELYIEKILPSPDGKQLLVYIRSSFWDTRFVWLLSMDGRTPRLLYESSADTGTALSGSFSQSGRWVTYDAAGNSSGKESYIPVYDCEKDLSDAGEPEREQPVGTELTYLYSPDQKLYYSHQAAERLLAASIYDRPDKAGLIHFTRQSDYTISVYQEYPLETSASEADSHENPSDYSHFSCYLYGYMGTPFLQYRYEPEENRIYYLGTTSQLRSLDIASFHDAEVFEFPALVWDFLPLDSGDFLVILVQEHTAEGYTNSETAKSRNTVTTYQTGNLAAIQDFWNIRSADLYLYPAGAPEGQLLYKNLQNLVSMEYDEATRRILLETCEDGNLSRRKCIILEL